MLALGAKNIRENNKWVLGNCPFARKTHFSGCDRKPSFAISVDNYGLSSFHCYTCGWSGLVLGLPWAIWRVYDHYPIELMSQIYDNEIVSETNIFEQITNDYVFDFSDKKYENFSFPLEPLRSQARKWLNHRNVSDEIIAKYRIQSSGNDVVFIVYDFDGSIAGYVLHDLTGKLPKYKTYKTKPFVLYGASNFEYGKRVIVVEGVIDCLVLESLGIRDYNLQPIAFLADVDAVLSIPTIDIISGTDADETGRVYAKKIQKMNPLVKVIDWSIIGKNDAGDLKSQQELGEVLKLNQIIGD